MAAMPQSWIEQPLDDFRREVGRRFDLVDHGFNLVDQRFASIDKHLERIDRHLERIDQRFERIDERFEAMHRMMLQGLVAVCGFMFTGFCALAGLIATQL